MTVVANDEKSYEKIIAKNRITANILRAVTIAAALLTILVLGFLIVYIRIDDARVDQYD